MPMSRLIYPSPATGGSIQGVEHALPHHPYVLDLRLLEDELPVIFPPLAMELLLGFQWQSDAVSTVDGVDRSIE
jgi:hypothetical protein